jgi:hypothetical protein
MQINFEHFLQKKKIRHIESFGHFEQSFSIKKGKLVFKKLKIPRSF